MQLVLAGLVTKYALLGGFHHLYYLSQAQIVEVMKWDYILQCFGILAMIPPKVSVSLLIIRVMHPLKGWRFWTIMASIAFMTLISILNAIFTYVQCIPPKALWDHRIRGKCWNPLTQANFSIFQACVMVLVDVILATIPSTIIWRLHMALRRRIALCLLLGVGLFAAACGSIKTSYLSKLSVRSDVTWAMYNPIIWSGSENFVVLFCGCVPPLKSLWDRYFARSSSISGSWRSCSGKGEKSSAHHRIVDTDDSYAAAISDDHPMASKESNSSQVWITKSTEIHTT